MNEVRDKPWSPYLMALLAICLTALSGCSTAGYRKSDAVAASMQTAAAEVQIESQEMERTMGYLNRLVNEPTADLRIAYKQFSGALERLKSTAKRTNATGTRMSRRGADYFQAWEKQLENIDYEHIRELSSGRRTEVTNRFAVIQQRYEDSQAAVDPLINYLQDIRVALNSDLTMAGIAALKPVVSNANASADKVRTALQALTTELVDSSTRFASLGQPLPSETKLPE